jgi:hypothetical protein
MDIEIMDEIDIVKVIRRRQAKFRDQRRPGSQEQMDQVARLIEEEYDALLAEIEAVRIEKSRDKSAAAIRSKAESDNQAAEAEILGDQGQSGG